ncbi:MAG: TrkH family potassium uptake protein [Filifactoraceae bacterium]
MKYRYFLKIFKKIRLRYIMVKVIIKEHIFMDKLKKRKKISKPAFSIVKGFMCVILIGALLLNTTFATVNGETPGFLNALFTSTSAVCVTGLVVVDTGTYWNIFGKMVILLLIQIGGIGFMSLTTLSALLLGKKISLRERILIQESLSQTDLSGIVKLNKHIMIGTLCVEGIGAILLATQFVPQFGITKGIFYSIFHSISAFCNAGFDLLGGFKSLTEYTSNYVINFTIMGLIVVGGLGFTVLFDIIKKKKIRRLNMHSKLVLSVTAFLILVGAIFFFIMEWKNPSTMGNMSMTDKVVASLFQSISPRTAGFNTIDQAALTNASKLGTILLMFIGGAPTSTAGGIKVTTIIVLILATYTLIKGYRDVEIFKKRISFSSVNKALAVFSMVLSLVLLGVMGLCIAQPNVDFLDLLYETVSAIGTVGLTTGITSSLNMLSKVILITLMFVGRVGVLTVLIAVTSKDRKLAYQLPEEKVII